MQCNVHVQEVLEVLQLKLFRKYCMCIVYKYSSMFIGLNLFFFQWTVYLLICSAACCFSLGCSMGRLWCCSWATGYQDLLKWICGICKIVWVHQEQGISTWGTDHIGKLLTVEWFSVLCICTWLLLVHAYIHCIPTYIHTCILKLYFTIY